LQSVLPHLDTSKLAAIVGKLGCASILTGLFAAARQA
jgi:hypothetical protein